MMRRQHILLLLLALVAAMLPFRGAIQQHVVMPVMQRFHHRYSIEDRINQYGPAARTRLMPVFSRRGVAYPPVRVVLVGMKTEKVLQVYAADRNEPLHFIRAYPILGASGELGPKLREGDMQVPEGIYRIESLNPNSAYHISLRINYPNVFDRAMAKQDQRTNLGGDIMIHGGHASIGCLAMGDEASEELFVLAHDTGLGHITLILTPVDARTQPMPTRVLRQPTWIDQLYGDIARELKKLPPVK